MKRNNIIKSIAAAFFAAAMVACSDNDISQTYNELIDNPQEEQPEEPGGGSTETPSNRNELYRPQIHFTPEKNWINDPNGMVYLDGTWHLFYQYNPQGHGWGNLSWGHATSTDLLHWTEQPVALSPDALGMIFSGSAVIDKDNTAGFGKDAMVAFYTSAGESQQQSLAYSTDGGKNFTKFENNPVIANPGEPDFRDPKVFWHEASKQWIMSLAKGWKYEIEFWGSKNLKNWTKLSTFSTPVAGCNKGQWECPDLLKFNYNGKEKWVLLVSVNPGGPVMGSGTQYFVGDFDGTTFSADENNYPLWIDYGMDNYAGVTWSNAPDGRYVFIGWMNNWLYADRVPATPWCSANTLPRELSLIEYNGKPLLANTVVSEIESLAGEWTSADGTFPQADAYELKVKLSLDKNSTITLGNAEGAKYVIAVDASGRRISTRRTAATGKADFSDMFSVPSASAPLNTESNEVTLHIFIDQSSVELFTENGSMAQTNLVFPGSIYNTVDFEGGAVETSVRTLKSIYK